MGTEHTPIAVGTDEPRRGELISDAGDSSKTPVASPADIRVKCLGIIEPKLLALEPELTRCKWFDYRPLTCERATQLCADAYEEAARRAHDFGVGNWSDRGSRPLRSKRFHMLPNKEEVTAMWKCRQMIDRLGVPYPFFFHVAFPWLFEQRNFRRVLRPNQLYGEKWAAKLADVVLKEWDERLRNGGFDRYLQHPEFRAENYRGTPDQNELIDLQVQWALEKPLSAADRVALLLGSRRRITVQTAKEVFEPELVERALALIEDHTPVSVRSMSTRVTRPSCFGLPGTHVEGSAICEACPSAGECKGVVDRFCASLRRVYGSEDPVAQARRDAAAMRKRKSRANKAASRELAAEELLASLGV